VDFGKWFDLLNNMSVASTRPQLGSYNVAF